MAIVNMRNPQVYINGTNISRYVEQLEVKSGHGETVTTLVLTGKVTVTADGKTYLGTKQPKKTSTRVVEL